MTIYSHYWENSGSCFSAHWAGILRRTGCSTGPKVDVTDEESALNGEGLQRGTQATALNVLSVLQFIAAHGEPASIREIADGTDMPKATLYRLLDTLVAGGWLKVSGPPKKFQASLRTIGLGLSALERHRVREVALPNVIGLATESRHSVFLSLYEDGEVFYLEDVDVVGDRIMPVPFYRRHPAFVTAAGQIILAYSDGDVVEAAIEVNRRLALPPEYESKSRETLLAELAVARERGYGTPDLTLQQQNITCACAVFDESYQPVASIGLFNLTPAHIPEIPLLAAMVQRWARLTSVTLGYRGARNVI